MDVYYCLTEIYDYLMEVYYCLMEIYDYLMEVYYYPTEIYYCLREVYYCLMILNIEAKICLYLPNLNFEL